MEVFFNELSARQPATSDTEARQWLETLARLGQSLLFINEAVSDSQFSFRRREEFGLMRLTATQTLQEFLANQFTYGDAVYNFLLGTFDAPYITQDDPKRSEFEYTSLLIDDEEHYLTGLSAAYLKRGLAVSFDTLEWDICEVTAIINRLTANGQQEAVTAQIAHANQLTHLTDCHLVQLSNLFDWSTYRPRFDSTTRSQTLLCLLSVYSFHVENDWKNFYHLLSQCNEYERVEVVKRLAGRIAAIQRWEPAIGSLKTQNRDRLIYTVPNSPYIVSVDTQHGEFEIHVNRKGPNHLGAISFDGLRFKPADDTRRLSL